MIMNAPSTFPNRRMQSASGRITTSIRLIGSIMAMGCVKLFSHPLTPFLRIPAPSIRIMLMTAKPAVTFRSFVGGFIPTRPITFAMPIKISTLDK